VKDLTEISRKLSRSSGVQVVLSEFGGECPVQAFGTVAYHGIETDLYFRARHAIWSVEIGEAPPFGPNAGTLKEGEWSYEEDWPHGRHAAGYMSVEDAEKCILKALVLWRASQERKS